ncbi:PREDICTED: uncharacterized protein LOC109231454 [Nicotiana attenuata]|uniref:uncharacterized protein LOC109231454 n=1 Tax=Nicotiana attenuata TaxID=49451 RepID=UPI0009057AFC|nr:PREDICTED: uncharacterized protein LOC109231454 [Nicotiana attenuata]
MDMICYNSNSAVISSECAQRSVVEERYNGDTIKIIEFGDGEDWNDTESDENTIITDPNHIDVEKGQIYKEKATIIKVMRHLAVKEKFQFKVHRSSESKYCLVCINNNCDWYFKSLSLKKANVFKVRNFSKVHSCPLKDRSYAQLQATAKLIDSLLIDKYKDPNIIYTPNDIIGDMNKPYGLQMTYMQSWRSKKYAVQVLRGNPSESYEKLPSYIYMLVLTNPMSVVSLKKTEEDLFMYAFVALYPSIKGWQYCKPVVVVDGTFLKSAYRGTLLIASTQDPAGNILPLAYAIVDSENNASWEWFFARFKDAFGEREGMCIVSDMHEGIENAAATLYPQVPHSVCIWHLWNNVKKNYKKKNYLLLKDIFFALAKTYTVEKFDYYLAEVEKIYKRLKDYLMNVG